MRIDSPMGRKKSHNSNAATRSFFQQYGLQFCLLLALIALILYALLRPEPTIMESVDLEPAPAEQVAELPSEAETAEEEEGVQVVTVEAISAEPEAQFFDLADVPILTDNVISPRLNPRTFVGKKPEHDDFTIYTVARGDTPARIAQDFNIKPETILGGNPSLNDNAGVLQVDQELLIMPIDGVLHDVEPGDSLESISKLYDVPVDDIIGYASNNLEFPYRLFPETQIVVPGAVREVFKWDPPTLSNTGGYWAGQSRPLIVGTGTFVWPVSGGRISQEYWYAHQAIDVAILDGSGTYASDSGTVTYASWSPYCFGNLIVINHGNGFETFYAHLSGINVVPGQIVYQGNLIGYTGNTGCSSGPHIHFEIRVNGNRDDPIWYLP